MGVVKRAVMFEPIGGAVVRTLDGSPGQSAACRLQNTTGEPMRLKLLTQNIPGTEVRVHEVTPGLSYDVILVTTKEMPIGMRRGTALFETGLAREPQINVGLQVKVLPRVEAQPPAIYVNPQQKDPFTRSVMLRYYGDETLVVTGASCADPNVTVSVGTVQPPRGAIARLKPKITAMVQTRVKVANPLAIPPKGLIVTYTTNDPRCPKVEVLLTPDKEASKALIYGTAPTERASPG